jgi:2-C-methyl-D-erythritol 4-phosphate cytidylyltransferase
VIALNSLEIGAVKFRNRLHQFFPNDGKNISASAIITAAGSGTRMGGVSKQLLPLAGKPCILYSLLAFQNCDLIGEIIVTSKEEEISVIREICDEFQITKLKAVVAGGQTRQESVLNGFLAVSRDSDFVAIHDAARPLIRSEQIQDLILTANRYGAACAASKVVDTVKRGNQDLMIECTIPREDLFAVQTPQIFRTDMYRVALALAKKQRISVTDDCALIENAGFPIKLCLLSDWNLKLTTPVDVKVVESILKERQNG